MFAKRVCFICVAAVLVAAGSASALSITTAVGNGADTYLANDSQSGIGTNGPDTTHGAEIRMRAFRQLADTRSKTGYIRFDITGIAGDMSGATLTFDATYLKGGARTVEVYGLIDGDDDFWDESTITYNTAAGVIPNPPTTLGNCVLDTAKVTLLGTITVPAAGGTYPVTFSSTPADLSLTSFLDADKNGLVTFLFIGTDNEGEIASKEHETFNPPTLNLPNAGMGPRTSALYLNPANEANDVSRDVVLSWTPGAFAATHDVYLGTSLDDVSNAGRSNPLGVLVSQGQDANTCEPPVRLAFSQTYYWRIDEVNAPPDAKIFPGAVWSFTTEPVVYRMQNIIATASSSAANVTPANTVDRSGLDASDLHSTAETTMWVSDKNKPAPAWIQYEFDGVYKLTELWVWNYNNSYESTLGFGFNEVRIEYSTNGTNWKVFGDVQFPQAPGEEGYAHNPPIDLQGVAARFVRLTAQSNFSGLSQFGLSEVCFFYTPAHPRQPQPAAGATGVNVNALLSWRAGREAAAHQVYFSTEANAVADGTAPVEIVGESRYDPGPLDLGRTYYWKVVEVNEAETPSVWESNVWSFATKEYFVVDDFESYNDLDEGSRIFDVWIDGWATGANGSVVGNIDPPFTEQTIVHGGKQAMPLDYNNLASPWYSEAERTWDTPQDWTSNGADALVLYFRGYQLGFVENSSTSITLSGSGTDIYGTADQFRFAYKRLEGNGTIIAKVESITDTDPWAKAGVMIRESLDPDARFAGVYATPGNGVRYQARLMTGGDATSDTSVATTEQKALTAPVWVKLERTGTTFNGSYSTDGVNWIAMSWNPQTLNMVMPSVYIGLAVTSHNAGLTAVGEFSGIATTGATGAWAQAAIGVAQPANAAGQFYVAVQDKAGHVAVVNHPDPQAVLLDTWQQWSIPLADLNAAGVNVTTVKTLYLGVGDRQKGAPGGTGRLLIDDILVGHPAATATP
jgi:hypothetical protein